MVNVRALTAEDWHLYKVIRLESVSLHPNVYGYSPAQEAARADTYWQEAVSRQDQRFFGLFQETTMIGVGGVVTSWNDTRTAVLIAGYIREDFRGQKLSRKLYEARIDWAKESGLFDRILVSHREGNDASRRANQAFGFVCVGVETASFGDGSRAQKFNYEMRLT